MNNTLQERLIIDRLAVYQLNEYTGKIELALHHNLKDNVIAHKFLEHIKYHLSLSQPKEDE